ncbi:hypothetical protein GCM10023195_25850 [Actinoallomurus liliacearum]|uniref:HTH gntR-type domain-containing protein n=1 Tax=Actinoallomurus liliacearum TaxID=1080073 RepID=A0ABP8TFG9_9ACTN
MSPYHHFPVDRPSTASTARRVAETIRARIVLGEYEARRRLPSQAELAAEFHTSGRTIAKAVADLRERRYVWTLPHKGSYARPPEHWLDPEPSES